MLTARSLATAPVEQIQQCIEETGLAASKAKKLKGLCSLVCARFESEEAFCKRVTHDELIDVKGIGPETAARIILFTCNRLAWPVDEYCLRVLHYRNILSYPRTSRDRKETAKRIVPMVHDGLGDSVENLQRFHGLLQLEGRL